MEKKGVLVPMVLAMVAAVVYLMVLTSKEKALSKCGYIDSLYEAGGQPVADSFALFKMPLLHRGGFFVCCGIFWPHDPERALVGNVRIASNKLSRAPESAFG